MKIALYDFDMTGYPNLALMKLSAWHKMLGDDVLPLNFIMGAEKIYGSCVFPQNAQRERIPLEAEVGGTGFDLMTWLPIEIEHIMPDYSLYGVDYSMGFTSRGCIRHCPWCLVPLKEGKIQAWADWQEFWNHQFRHIRLLDNNLLASPNWRETLEGLIAKEVIVDFNQGLDIRLVTPEVANLLARVKRWLHGLRFAFDSLALKNAVLEGTQNLLAAGIRRSYIQFYVLLGFWPPRNDLARLQILSDLGVSIYPMQYKPITGSPPSQPIGEEIVFDGFPWFHSPRGQYWKAYRLMRARLGAACLEDKGRDK